VRRKREESGAALVEFALLLPVFMALILGMFSGGVAYNQKLDLTHATREGARYGAAVSKDTAFASGTWESNVKSLVVDRASGDLSGSGVTTCVALVTKSPAEVVANPTGVSGNYYSTTGSPCFTDTTSDVGMRVQVRVTRPSKIEALFFSWGITLNAKAVSRYECQASTCQ